MAIPTLGGGGGSAKKKGRSEKKGAGGKLLRKISWDLFGGVRRIAWVSKGQREKKGEREGVKKIVESRGGKKRREKNYSQKNGKEKEKKKRTVGGAASARVSVLASWEGGEPGGKRNVLVRKDESLKKKGM